jgi:hypothetical protein
LNDPFELPSLEEIEQMDRQRSQAIESLEITDHSVKCQRCGNAVPIIGKMTRTNNDRIAVLQKRIKWIENYSHGNTTRSSSHINDIKELKQELSGLLSKILYFNAARLTKICKERSYAIQIYYLFAIGKLNENVAPLPSVLL